MDHPARIFFSNGHPTFAILGAEFIETRREQLSLRFEAKAQFVEDVMSGELHSGFCTLLLDSVMGGAVMGSLASLQPIATVNLTTQHLSRPVLGDNILCTGTVERIEAEIAVVRGRLVHEQSGDILASAVGSFMIGTRGVPVGKTSNKDKVVA